MCWAQGAACKENGKDQDHCGDRRRPARSGSGYSARRLWIWNVDIYMAKKIWTGQALNVYRMELLGAKVHRSFQRRTGTLKDAVNETMREWTRRMEDTLYVLGSVMGPHPFPMMVREFPEGDRKRDTGTAYGEGRAPS